MLINVCHFIDPSTAPELTLNGSTKSSSPIPQNKEPSPISSSRSRKTRGKEKALPPSGTTTNGVIPGDDAESSSSEEEQGEEEVDEEEEELGSDKAVNTKRLVFFSVQET